MSEAQHQCWLVTGGSGQVGTALRKLDLPGVKILAPPRSELDLVDLPDLSSLISREKVAVVINCGAYTAVDRAESEPELAALINAIAPARLAQAAKTAGIPILHVSTDYVFAADGKGPWVEEADISPASVYGRTKADGEHAVRESGARHSIVRTSWVVSATGRNFVKTMLNLGAERDKLRVVDDQVGAPTHAGDLAAALALLAQRFINDPRQASGTWHFANQGETTWYGLARHVFEQARLQGSKTPQTVEPISTLDYPTPATRPRDSRLDTTKIGRDFGIRPRPWQDSVSEIVTYLLTGDAE